METKRCPKCGGEIPVGMQFCLHCMERTDGVLEIKQKHIISRKRILLAVIVLCIIAATIGVIAVMASRQNHSPVSEQAAATSEEPLRTDSNAAAQTTTTELQNTGTTLSETDTANTDMQMTQDKTPDAFVSNSDNNIQPDIPEQPSANQDESAVQTSAATQPQSVQTAAQTNTPAAQSTVTVPEQTNTFENWFRSQLSRWGGSKIYQDTLVFNGDSCTFDVQIVLSHIPAELNVSADRRQYTLILHTAHTDLTTLSQIEDVIKEINFLVMNYSASGVDVQTINSAASNSGTEYTVDADNKHWIIQTNRNGDAQPVTVSCTSD